MSDEDTGPKGKKSAVDAPRKNYFVVDPFAVVVIGKDTADDEKHPLFDPRINLPIDEAMVANIMYYGVLKPVEVTKDGDRLVVVDGRRRVLHARIAKQRQIERGDEPVGLPIILRKGDDAHLFGVSRTHNAFHSSDGPLTNAYNARRMIDMGKTEAEVALTFGVTLQAVKNWLQLLSAHKDVIDAVKTELLTFTAAMHIAALSKAEQTEVLVELTAGGTKPTAADAQKRVREKAGKAPGNTPKERIERATNVLTKYALAGVTTKEAMETALERVTKILTGGSLEKLAKTDEE